MSMIDNFKQAAQELLNDPTGADQKKKEAAAQVTDQDAARAAMILKKSMDETPVPPAKEKKAEPAKVDDWKRTEAEDAAKQEVLEKYFGHSRTDSAAPKAAEPAAPAPAPAPARPAPAAEPAARPAPFAEAPQSAPDWNRPASTEPVTTQTTRIAEGTVIEGTVRAAGAVELDGEVVGNVSGADMKITGRLFGNAAGANIDLLGGKVKGDLIAQGHINVGETAVVVGNISAKSLDVSGKIKGDLTIQEMLCLRRGTVLLGNAQGGRISLEEGAVFQGQLRMEYTEAETSFDFGMPEPPAKTQPAAAPKRRSINN